jgi:hypothetical protein
VGGGRGRRGRIVLRELVDETSSGTVMRELNSKNWIGAELGFASSTHIHGEGTEVRLRNKAVCIDRWTLHRSFSFVSLLLLLLCALNTHPCRTEAWVCGAWNRMELIGSHMNHTCDL